MKVSKGGMIESRIMMDTGLSRTDGGKWEMGTRMAKKMNEMAGVRLTGFARNLLWEGLALVSPRLVW